jgi:phosphodiesterase/alkaline phosphatase D-like protein
MPSFSFLYVSVLCMILCRGAVAHADQVAPPQLGNATRNGWADQHSIVIWTRTTRHAEIQVEGFQFRQVPASLESKIRDSGELHRYMTDQMPEGARLEDMFGACPGFPGLVRLVYHPLGKPDERILTEWKETRAKEDYTVQWRVNGLLPATEYSTLVEARPVGGEMVTASSKGRFRTAPSAEDPASVRFCMTTCHDFLRRDDGEKGHRIYLPLSTADPDFVVHAGDIEYYDKPQPWAWTVGLMRFKWARLFSMPRNRLFYARHTSYFIKDDHDTLKNDSWAGQVYGRVSFEEGVALFNQEQFPSRNPRYHTVGWGSHVQIWLLEGRDYRSPNRMKDGSEKTILGAAQKNWLKETLRASRATFKLVFSPTPILGPDRPNKKDNHANESFAHEGRELRTFLGDVDGVVLFCGDRHWQYASVDETTGLWEFGCGPGSEKHQFGWKKGDRRSSHRFLRVDAGYLSGKVTSLPGSAPELLLRHHDVEGNEKSRFVFQGER